MSPRNSIQESRLWKERAHGLERGNLLDWSRPEVDLLRVKGSDFFDGTKFFFSIRSLSCLDKPYCYDVAMSTHAAAYINNADCQDFMSHCLGVFRSCNEEPELNNYTAPYMNVVNVVTSLLIITSFPNCKIYIHGRDGLSRDVQF